MDPTNSMTIAVSSHNVNGFCRNKNFIHDLCDSNVNSIRAIQEHWLKPPYKKQKGVNQLRMLHPDFDGYGSSAMNKSVQSQILKGRPYGGTGFLFNKKYSRCLKPLLNFTHERVTVMRLETASCDILLINVYFPYHNTNDINHYLAMYKETVGYVDSVMANNRECKFIILADLNCNIYDSSHPYTPLVRNLMERYNLFSCFDSIPNFDHKNSFTRSDVKTKSFTLIDCVLISEGLRDKVDNVRISSYGNNLSDHNPIEFDLHVSIVESQTTKPKLAQFINWKKLTESDLDRFRNKMKENLASINVPFHEILHGDKCCFDNHHQMALEQYYRDIISAVINAESVLPKLNPNFQRDFWDSELSDLKARSMECDKSWKKSW